MAEINTIGDLLSDVGADRLYKQTLPTQYVANTIGIRWQGDSSESETAYHYRIDRLYQIIYFASSEIKCIQTIPALQKALNQHIKAALRGSGGYITLEPLAMSAPFKTDTDGVYAVVGVLPVSVRVPREFAEVSKIGGLGVTVDAKASDGVDEKYTFSTNTCGNGEDL